MRRVSLKIINAHGIPNGKLADFYTELTNGRLKDNRAAGRDRQQRSIPIIRSGEPIAELLSQGGGSHARRVSFAEHCGVSLWTILSFNIVSPSTWGIPASS